MESAAAKKPGSKPKKPSGKRKRHRLGQDGPGAGAGPRAPPPSTAAGVDPSVLDHGPSKVELAFARRLADNQLKVRNKAVRKLRLWLSQPDAVHTAPDLMKLWKGLFYCMWMSDKPLVQEDLARKLSGLTECFPTDDGAMLFVSTFYATMEREWQGIDRLRLDKFYHLLLEFLRQAIARVQRAGWAPEAVSKLVAMLESGPLDHTNGRLALGIALHICDHVVVLLTECGAAEAPASSVEQLLAPFWRIVAGSHREDLIARVDAAVVDKLIESVPSQEEDAEDAEFLFAAADAGSPNPMDVNWDAIAATFFERAADPDTPIMNREQLYTIRRKLTAQAARAARVKARHASAGVAPQAVATAEPAVDAADASASATPRPRKRRKKKRSEPADAVAADALVEQPTTAELPTVAQDATQAKPELVAPDPGAAGSAVGRRAESAAKAKKRKQPATGLEPETRPRTPIERLKGTSQLKSALGTPQDFTAPRRSARLSQNRERRVSWGRNQVRSFKKKLPPTSVSAEKRTKSVKRR